MSLSTKLIEQRDALVAEVESTIAAEDVTAEALTEASAKQEEIAALDERIATAQATEKRTAELIAGAHEFALARGVLWGEYASDPKKAKDLIRDNWPKQI